MNPMMKAKRVSLLGFLLVGLLSPRIDLADETRAGASFLRAKTLFQTNRSYDPRIAIAVDAVMVHCHGANDQKVRDAIASWKQHGYPVGRMFFADSDAGNIYWTGKWDGTPHPDDVERNVDGKVVKCARIRPYMLPTEGWTKYLEDMVLRSIDAGADAIVPEEPLAHVDTGYEKSFRQLWQQRYGKPWQPENASPEARFLTARLKSELYAHLLRRLADVTQGQAQLHNKDVAFIVPVHPPYSNVAARLVAPLGTSLAVEGIDGYIGQVWTGPVRWALSHYRSPDKSFFASAYALYDYFVSMTVGTGRKLWLLADPVADNPNHTWSEFQAWYQHCVVAKLLFPEADAFEVMPWPERIFLPGFRMAGGTPAPEPFRIKLLAVIQVLQELPRVGQWCVLGDSGNAAQRMGRVGVAVSDTLMWQKKENEPLNGVYGLLLPLIEMGVPVSACLMERCRDTAYLSRFDTIVLSCDDWKPMVADVNHALIDWAKRGGSLVVLGTGDGLNGDYFWWERLGYSSLLHHLLAALNMPISEDTDQQVDRGWVFRRVISPRRFTDPSVAHSEYWPIVSGAAAKAGYKLVPSMSGRFCMRRGPFLVAHSATEPMRLPGPLIDIFDPDLPMLDGVRLEPGQSGLYRDVSALVNHASGEKRQPCVLHTTHRLMSQYYAGAVSRITLRGPAETPAVVRLYCAGRGLETIIASDADGEIRDVASQRNGETLKLQFPNHPQGVTLEIRWSP